MAVPEDVMEGQQRAVVAAVARMVAAVCPGALSVEQATGLLELAGEIERLGAGLRLLVAARAAEGAQWHEQGLPSPAAWVAGVAGTSMSEARTTIETSARLAAMPALSGAVRAGGLAAAQARAISLAVAADPASEAGLVDSAPELGVDGLARVCRQIRTQPPPTPAPGRASRRFLRFRTDDEGLIRLSGALGADDGAGLVALVRSRAAFVADEAIAAGLEPESPEVYDADALVALVAGDRRMATFAGNVGGRTRSATIVVHVAEDALRRGRAEVGELCEVEGVGPVPFSILETVAGDAKVLFAGPVVAGEVAKLLESRDPTCVVPGCSVSLGLDTVFWQVPWTRGGAAEPWNLARLCRHHHRQHGLEGFTLTGGPGGWGWHPPP